MTSAQIELMFMPSATVSAIGRYMYMSRALIIDSRDSFGADWDSSGGTDAFASARAAMSTSNSKSLGSIIYWHDYFMPPRQCPSEY